MLFKNVLLFNYYIMKHLPICTPTGDISTFRIKLKPHLVQENCTSGHCGLVYETITELVETI